MKKVLIICCVVLVICSILSLGQTKSKKTEESVKVILDKQNLKKSFLEILKAEDELRFDETLENFLKNGNLIERERAALAAGRIGDKRAIPFLSDLLEKDASADVRRTAAFALGEIESIEGAGAILKILKNQGFPAKTRARAVEAAGKIAAANAKDAKASELGEAILNTLEFENRQASVKQSKDVILLGITAALRAKPDEADYVLAKFLTNLDGRVRADAANALARLRVKTLNEKFRAMLLTDKDPIARANAARALGAGEDKDAVNILTEAAVTDEDLRVRINAIRALGGLKSEKSADKLMERGRKLLQDHEKSKFANPVEQNELLDLITALGNILQNTKNEAALDLLIDFSKANDYKIAEAEIAIAKIFPGKYADYSMIKPESLRTAPDALIAATRAYAAVSEELNAETRAKIIVEIRCLLELTSANCPSGKRPTSFSKPQLINAFAPLKPAEFAKDLRAFLMSDDLFIRTTAAGLLGEQETTEENIKALQDAFEKSLETDRDYNDAQLAILSALVKLDKKRAIRELLIALDHHDYLLRRHAANLIKEHGLDEGFPKIPNAEEKVGTLKTYDKKNKSKLGQILNSEKDYERAFMRENGKVRAVLTTEKGIFTIELLPDDAPLTVDNFVKLARSKYFNNVAIHRVVPNFVVQDGDPTGNGSGGPGWQIRDEMNMVAYERGVVGMALSGPNTGGSQWFVTHSPQPHLDGGYTVFGRVNETDMKIVDMLVRGDKILKIEIVEDK